MLSILLRCNDFARIQKAIVDQTCSRPNGDLTVTMTFFGCKFGIGKDSDAGRDWGQEEKGTTEDEMAGWHHLLDGCESQ